MIRYQNMWQTKDVERALKRYNTDKGKLNADSVNFQPIDDMDIGEHKDALFIHEWLRSFS